MVARPPVERVPPAASRGPLREARLYTGEDAVVLDVFETAAGAVAVATIGDARKSGPNEDSAAVLPLPGGRLVLIVADGVGGLPAARRASNVTVEAIRGALANLPADAPLRGAILDAIDAANGAVRGLGAGAASTLALAEVGPGYVRSYHVGDSIILLCGQRGCVKLQTVPHSPVGFAVEAGLIDARDALHHAELNLIFNVIGSAQMRIEVGSPQPLAPRDTLVLASDGLADNLHQEEIVATVCQGPIGGVIEALATKAQARMTARTPGQPCKPDDFTALLYRPARTAARRGSARRAHG